MQYKRSFLSLSPSPRFHIAKRPKSIIFFGFEFEPFRHLFFIVSTASWQTTAAAAIEAYEDVRFRSSSPNVRNIAVFNENRMNNIIIFYGVAKRYGRALRRFFMRANVASVCMCVCTVWLL